MSNKEVEEFRMANNNIVIESFDPANDMPFLKPTPSFHSAFHNYPEMLDTIAQQGFEKPSPIQAQVFLSYQISHIQ